MIWTHPVLALVLALAFGFLLVGLFGWRHPRRPAAGASVLFLLLLLFPLLWAAAVWYVPVGSTAFGAAVLPLVVPGVLLVLLVAVLAAPRPGPAREQAEADTAAAVFGAAFWVLLLAAAATIIAGYVA